MSRSETMPFTPSGPTTTMAPMLCSASPASNSVTVASGLIVTTAPPLPRNTSAIRMKPPAECDQVHTQATARSAAMSVGERNQIACRRQRLGQSGDFDDHVEVGGPCSGVNALQRRHVRIVATDADSDVLLVDLGVVGRVVVPPASGPRLNPGMALAVDGVADLRVGVGLGIAGHIA